jgi:hypothetical protein
MTRRSADERLGDDDFRSLRALGLRWRSKGSRCRFGWARFRTTISTMTIYGFSKRHRRQGPLVGLVVPRGGSISMWKVPLGQRCTKSQTCGSSTAQRGIHREIPNMMEFLHAMPAVELVALPADMDCRLPSCWSATKRVRNKHDRCDKARPNGPKGSNEDGKRIIMPCTRTNAHKY